ncbi:hypothetical protein PS1_031115 [Malus domestica]
MLRRRRKEKTFRWKTEYRLPQSLPKSNMADRPKNVPSEKSEGIVTNEDLQATMVQVLRSMEKISLETKGEVSKLCSLTGSLQRRLDMEYSTPKNDYARGVTREANPEKEPVIPFFPLLEEKNGKNKNNGKFGTSGPVLEEILEAEMPDP